MATIPPRLLLHCRRLPAQARPSKLPIYRLALSRLDQTRRFTAQAGLQLQHTETSMGKVAYHAAASFSGKYTRFDPVTSVFHFNQYNRIQSTQRPKSKRPSSGQDAFFIARMGDSNAIAFGVADGVGGWEESGVDPADFSHGFCDYMAAGAYEYKPDGSGPPLTARSLMQKGYDDVCNDRSIPAGGSTACVAIASEDGTLDVANLGDSGFVQLRLNAVHSYSEPQTHAFNTPYQLSVIPASMLARAAAFGGAQLCDHPKDADVTKHTLKHGDILVVASDGLWDNLFNQDILRIASRLMTGSGAWQVSEGGTRVVDDLAPLTQAEESTQRPATLQSALALEITKAAKAASMNKRVDGPFAKEVQKYYPQEGWHGGKVDDICVVVVVVSEDGKGPATKAKL
ncbi:phosphatase 2C-like domain-containing protein [Pseudomassariella vexata]|uniref:Protein phosphatase n=1 Tax=Pseudomassariella vexata TaxID=1141098 RepID=A0A1Y2DSP0_9PEZI|nr:phosphatase 2C-like domain-containing protein [Pseudomassariella vexata]ORY62179.1 phosphatase 2C-like domain-containing protein [Pseudomassariella vexata]